MAHEDHPNMHKRKKRAPARATTTTRAPRSTTTTVAGTTTSSASVTSVGRSGVANTDTATAPVPTTPPSSQTLATAGTAAYSVPFASLDSDTSAVPTLSSTSTSVAPTASDVNTSDTGAKPILTKPELWGIVGGAGAIGVAIFCMLCWWCWRKRKAKRDEAQWWSLDASYDASKAGAGKPVRLDDRDLWAKEDTRTIGEKSFRNDTPSPGPQRPSDDRPFAQYATATPAEKELAHQRARDLLLGPTMLAPARTPERERANDVITFGGSQAGHSSYASSLNPSLPPQALLPSSASAASVYTSDTAVFHPLRSNVQSGYTASQSDYGGSAERAQKRQSMRSAPSDLPLSLGEASGSAVPSLPLSGGGASIVPPLRGASVRRGASPTTPATPNPLYNRDGTIDPVVNSFPPPPRSPPGRSEVTSNAFGRVDSKPLRELEDILDSFSHNPNGGLPPIPDADSSRSLSVSSKASDPSRPTVTPLQLRRPEQSLSPYAAAQTLGSNQYELNHNVMSIYSSRGDIGEVPSSQTPSPTRSFSYGDQQPSYRSSPMPTPTIIRSDSRGNAYHHFSPDPHDDSLRRSLSEASEEFAPSSPQVVRKISLKKTEAPVRLTRNESLRQREQQRSGRYPSECSSQPLDSSTSISFHSSLPWHDSPPSGTDSSPPRTPRDVGFEPDPSGKSFDNPSSNGFVPLSSMTLDVASQNYRSTTESFYGLYDDLPAELQALSKDDPRVSRHISQHYGNGTPARI